jgi:hypothetical protein
MDAAASGVGSTAVVMVVCRCACAGAGTFVSVEGSALTCKPSAGVTVVTGSLPGGVYAGQSLVSVCTASTT